VFEIQTAREEQVTSLFLVLLLKTLFFSLFLNQSKLEKCSFREATCDY